MHSRIICPYSKGKEIVRNGFYRYKINVEQRYRCKSCGKSSMERSRSPSKGIRLYTEFYLSSNECSILIKDILNVEVSGISLPNWSKDLHPFSEDIKGLQT